MASEGQRGLKRRELNLLGMKVTAVKTRIFKEGEDLFGFIVDNVPVLREASVLVVTSKIVALAERRTAKITGEGDKEKLIRQESEFAMPTKWTWLTIKDGMVMASAGIDESNADGKVVLLPGDSYAAAAELRTRLKEKFGLEKLGVLLTDSRTLPLRAGVIGVSVGYAGMRGVRNYIGKPDIFGRLMTMSRTDVVDSLAAADVLEMGEGAEQIPLAVIEGANVEFVEEIDRDELKISIEDDMYLPLFGNFIDKNEKGD